MGIPVGAIVYSKAGRDKGRYYVVVKTAENLEFVYIADGELRKLERPKIKKEKHLRDTKFVIEKLAEKFTGGKVVHNAEVRSALRPYNDKTDGTVEDTDKAAEKDIAENDEK
ncbi:MAG: KOW domain-containing RNA-binding protein [Clostridiales bacterium]|jgi:ribosomal protein L14E/L6E/L27E|nr:KOW domain-containing RNA-binding protein [Clostridiales bacterium]